LKNSHPVSCPTSSHDSESSSGNGVVSWYGCLLIWLMSSLMVFPGLQSSGTWTLGFWALLIVVAFGRFTSSYLWVSFTKPGSLWYSAGNYWTSWVDCIIEPAIVVIDHSFVGDDNTLKSNCNVGLLDILAWKPSLLDR